MSGKDSTSSVMSTGSEDGSTSGSDGSDIDGDIEIIDPDNVRTKDSGLSVVPLKVGMWEVILMEMCPIFLLFNSCCVRAWIVKK